MSHHKAATGIHYLNRYTDVRLALKDPRFAIHKPLTQGDAAAHLASHGDGQSRSRRISPLSRILSEQLSQRAIQALIEPVGMLVDTCLAKAASQGRMDVVADLAYPVPVFVMQELLGLPFQPLPELRPLFDAITGGHDLGASEQDRQHAHLALLSISRWLQPLLRNRRPTPLMDAIMATVAAEGIDESLLLYWCTMLLYAGSTTTKDLIANVIGTLTETPEQSHQLVRHPEIMDTAMEELLRYDGPVRGVGRVATENMEVAGLAIQRGEIVYLMLSEANRDPEHFAAPDTLDLRRHPNPHIAFGYGITYCLGAHLARLETQIVLSKLLPFLDGMRPLHPPAWSASRLLRERSALAVSLG